MICILKVSTAIFKPLHTDGHHKLVRWRFITHGGIDGFSRLIVYLKCSVNNKASTVYENFTNAISEYGLPSRVRSDYGMENYMVARHMLRYHGLNHGSAITGSSTHSQRMERLWCDLHQSVTKMYYQLFYFLEHHGLLDPLNEVHLYSLHYVYLPRINTAISIFRDGWNSHGLRTMHNSSPRQLFVSGALRLYHSGLAALDFFNDVDDSYGIDEEEEISMPEEPGSVVIPESTIRLAPEHLELLQQRINPLAVCDDHAVGMYESTVQLLESFLNS